MVDDGSTDGTGEILKRERTGTGMTIDIIRSIRGMEQIEGEWNRLAEVTKHPLLQFDWFHACARTLHAETDFRIATFSRGGRIAAIAPLCLDRGLEGRLTLLGVSILGEPSGLLYEDPHALDSLILGLSGLRQPILLLRVPAEASLAGRFRADESRCGSIVVERRGAGSAAVPIQGTWMEFLEALPGKRRYDLRRARRRAEEAGKLEIRTLFCPPSGDIDRYLDTAFRVEASGWKGRRGSSILQNKRLARFFRLYCTVAAVAGHLRLSFLEVDGQAIATQIGVEFGGRYWILKIGYDEKWSKCSPGMQLMMESTRYAFEQGLEALEFLGSDEEWLRVWPLVHRSYDVVGVYPWNPRGFYCVVMDFGRSISGRYRRIREIEPPKSSSGE